MNEIEKIIGEVADDLRRHLLLRAAAEVRWACKTRARFERVVHLLHSKSNTELEAIAQRHAEKKAAWGRAFRRSK